MLGTTTTTIVASPSAGRQFTIKQIMVTNTSGTDRVVTIAVGTAATAANAVLYRLPVAGYDTVIWDTALVLEVGETLQGLTDLATSVNVTCTGWEREN